MANGKWQMEKHPPPVPNVAASFLQAEYIRNQKDRRVVTSFNHVALPIGIKSYTVAQACVESGNPEHWPGEKLLLGHAHCPGVFDPSSWCLVISHGAAVSRPCHQITVHVFLLLNHGQWHGLGEHLPRLLFCAVVRMLYFVLWPVSDSAIAWFRS